MMAVLSSGGTAASGNEAAYYVRLQPASVPASANSAVSSSSPSDARVAAGPSATSSAGIKDSFAFSAQAFQEAPLAALPLPALRHDSAISHWPILESSLTEVAANDADWPLQAEAMALALGKILQEQPHTLLLALNKLGIAVATGSQNPKVDSYLEGNGALAAYHEAPPHQVVLDKASGTHLPYSALSPVRQAYKGTLLLHSSLAVEEGLLARGQGYLDKVRPQSGNQALSNEVLLHELYHVAHHLTQPPRSSQQQVKEVQAYQLAYAYWQPFTAVYNHPVKRLALLAWELPIAHARHCFSRMVSKASKKPSETVKGIQEWMRQEMDACHFVNRHADTFKLSRLERQNSRQRLRLYEAFYQYAWLVKTNEAKQLP